MKIETREMERSFVLERKSINEEARTVNAALSSETPVERYFGTEILVHEEGAINMERAADGLPLLWSHDTEAPIGRVTDIRLDADRVLRGQLKFSNNKRASEVWQDVREGFLRDLSIGYRIDEYREEDDDVVRVTRFTPLEASVVTVPADSKVGIHRNHQEVKKMTDSVENDGAVEDSKGQPKSGNSVAQEMRLLRLDKKREQQAGAQLEHARIRAIDELFDRYELRFGEGSFGDLKRLCLDNIDISADKAKSYIDEAILDGHVSVDVSARQEEGSNWKGLPKISPKSRIYAGEEDQIDKFQRGAELALAIRAGTVVEKEQLKEAQSGEFLSMAPSEMAREYLRIHGVRAVGDREKIIGQALKFQRDGISHGTGHFAGILENVSNKSMLEGFSQAEESYMSWVQQRSIPDFKTTSLVNLSLFNGLEQVREGGQYTHGDMSDIKEQIQLATYGRLFTISRQALANDDLSALGDIPRAMGMAAAYQVGDIVYAVLTTGTSTTMVQDGVALFDASTHTNYVTSGAAPSVATLNAGRTAMATQTDPQGKVIGLRPRHLIVPIALQTTAETLIAATYDPAGTAGTLTPNPFQNSMQVVSDHRLDTANAAGWYLAAGMNTVTVGFLNGQSSPYLESKDGWSVDGVEYKVRIDAAAVASDYRGLYYNDGA